MLRRVRVGRGRSRLARDKSRNVGWCRGQRAGDGGAGGAGAGAGAVGIEIGSGSCDGDDAGAGAGVDRPAAAAD